MEIEAMRDVVCECQYSGYGFHVIHDSRGAIFLRGSYEEADVDTGVKEMQLTRRWFLSPEMTKSEIVQTVFKCVMTSMEHRCREWFRYRSKAVFGPHFDVDALWDICADGKFDRRK